MRSVEWCGGGGKEGSMKLWSGVLGSPKPSRPMGAKLRGKVMDVNDLRSLL
jgi:hypothetical protein